jgi:uncharacterized protein
MLENKKTVEKYLAGFNKGNHEQILSCLTDDVVWDMPGFIHLVGKEAFDKEIENPGFVGRPIIRLIRMVEENNVVVAEGSVRCQKKTGDYLNAVFCDVFLMQNGKIKQLNTYQMETKGED